MLSPLRAGPDEWETDVNRANIYKGVFAGLIAAGVTTGLTVLKHKYLVMPEVSTPAVMSGAVEAGFWASLAIWTATATVVWGGLFGALATRLPGSTSVSKATVYAVAVWLLMQLIVLPLAGAGLFGAEFGFGAPVVTLFLYSVYGVVLGAVFAWLKGEWRVHHHDDVHGAMRYTHY